MEDNTIVSQEKRFECLVAITKSILEANSNMIPAPHQARTIAEMASAIFYKLEQEFYGKLSKR